MIESTAISINNTIFLGLYRPPSGSKQTFTETLSQWTDSQTNKNVYISGDFNLNYLNRDKDYFDSYQANTGLEPKIKEITRIVSGSCIDNIFTNINSTHKVAKTCLADHQGLISLLKLNIKREEKKQYKYRDMKEENWLRYKTEVSKLVIRGSTTNEKWSNLSADIKHIVEISFPEKSSTNNYLFTMSQGLLKSKNKKNRLLRQYKSGSIEKEVH